MAWISSAPDQYIVKYTSDGEPFFLHKFSAMGGRYSIGRYTYIHGNTRVTGNEPISIGSFCSVASGVRFHCGDNHNLNHMSTYPFKTVLGLDFGYKEVVGDGVKIGNDVWIGEGARILSGVTIGDGVVLGANSLVSRSLMPYGVYVGNPAKLVRMRFSSIKIEMIKKLKWWNWPIDKIDKHSEIFSANLLSISDVEFCKMIDKIKNE